MIGEKLGRWFEIGFNAGLLNYCQQRSLCPEVVEYYRRELAPLTFTRLVKRMLDQEQVLNQPEEAINLEKWAWCYLARGFLAGVTFLPEYLAAVGWLRLDKLQIRYCQASFSDANSLGWQPKGQTQFAAEMLSQLGLASHEVDWAAYSQKGEFLRADTLLWLVYRQKYHRVLALDLAVFSVRVVEDLGNLDNVETLRGQLATELAYLKAKSVFANLSLDTGALSLAAELGHYFTAFKRQDKETVKLIQAASYAASFHRFLTKYKLLPAAADNNHLAVNVVGYTDRGMNTLTLMGDNLKLLQTCAHIYKQPATDHTIQTARQEVLRVIGRNAARSFTDGRELVAHLLNAAQPDQTTLVNHHEELATFTSINQSLEPDLLTHLGLPFQPTGWRLREAHAELIRQSLTNPAQTYLFLTGNPGIGKTTTIVEFLKAHSEEGFLFLYVSPRKQVNLDVLNKFQSPDVKHGKGQSNDRLLLLGLTTNAELIRANQGQLTVQYLSHSLSGDFTRQGVHFVAAQDILEPGFGPCGKNSAGLKRTMEDVIEAGDGQGAGVLHSLCEALHTAISTDLSTNIVATVAIQALKKTSQGEDTLQHFGKIFKSAYIEKSGQVLAPQMQAIAGKLKHLFVMVDEITGDESGVEFLARLSGLLTRYELLGGQHGFNTKVIVADASLVDAQVVEQHLTESKVEPDKIFFRKVTQPDTTLPLSSTSLNFAGQRATLINANSYPASRLHLTYRIFIETYRHSVQASLANIPALTKRVQTQIGQDLLVALEHSPDRQVLVYIQDKRRLAELIEQLQKVRPGRFERNIHYLEVHANLSEAQKRQVQEYANQVQVVFMTASASRGLSFPKASHILVEIPHFEIESNLMEIIQVIYRGRGSYWDTRLEQEISLDEQPRYVTFYLAERIPYYASRETENEPAGETRLGLQEGIMSVLNILLVLKTSLMTRIQGYGQIGPDRYLMIPIGGKAVSAAGETFSQRMSTLIKELEKQQYTSQHRKDVRLKQLYTQLRQLLSAAEISLTTTATVDSKATARGNHTQPNPEQGHEQAVSSFLSLRRTFEATFTEAITRGFDKLLDFKPMETGYIQGSLLIVPVAGKNMAENYLMRLSQELESWFSKPTLLCKMYAMRDDPTYPESLRFALNDALSFIQLLREQPDKTQWLFQATRRDDQYYAVPLCAFLNGKVLRDFYTSGAEESEGYSFKELLTSYLRWLFPAEGFLPIGTHYGEFPFVLFKSYTLRERRSKLFAEKYLLTSRELSLLNLILSV
jgi:hypothetical protein